MSRLMLALVMTALAATGAATAAPGGKGGKPGGGSPPQPLPVSLGSPPDCGSSWATALNNAPFPDALQVAGYANCPGAGRATLWSAATSMVDLGSISPGESSQALGISDGGTTVGWSRLNAFVRPPGGPMTTLPGLPGAQSAAAYGIAANGLHIAGFSINGANERRAVRWTLVNGLWEVTDLGPGSARAVSDAGLVVGNGPDGATVWSGATVSVLPGIDAAARGVTTSGNAIAGFRWEICTNTPSCRYEIPVLWKRNANGSWSAQDLPALDGVDSEALGVAEIAGKIVAVGYGFTKKDGIQRAVAWLPDAGGSYAAPLRLAALNGRNQWGARAEAVNSRGQVAGDSQSGALGSSVAVVWTLP